MKVFDSTLQSHLFCLKEMLLFEKINSWPVWDLGSVGAEVKHFVLLFYNFMSVHKLTLGPIMFLVLHLVIYNVLNNVVTI